MNKKVLFLFIVLLIIIVIESFIFYIVIEKEEISDSSSENKTLNDSASKFYEDNFSSIQGEIKPYWENVIVRLIHNGKIVGDISPNKEGEFEFKNLDNGTYGLLFIHKNETYIYNDEETEGKWYVNGTIMLKNIEFIKINSQGNPLEISFDLNNEKSDYAYRILKVSGDFAEERSITKYIGDAEPHRWMPEFWTIIIPENKTIFEMIDELKSEGHLDTVEPFIINHPALDEGLENKEFDYEECLNNPQQGPHVPGEVGVEFIQDITKEEVNNFLSQYNLSPEDIDFPNMVDFRIDFAGDEEGFKDYLNQNGFIKRDSRNPRYFLLRYNQDIKCNDAEKIFYLYPDVLIDKVFCFRNIDGVVNVLEGEENKWICELQKSILVRGANLNMIASVSAT